jgi:Family of unknown function (DUF5681)
METISSSESAEGQRNKRGQWVPGMSGNRSGRRRKEPALPKGLKDHLADAMMEKIPLSDGQGKHEMVPAFEAVARHLVRSLPGLKARELITALQWMDKLEVFRNAQARRE